MIYMLALIAGIVCGAVSWGLGAAFSGAFEPFDSLIGFLTTQIVLSGVALAGAARCGVKPMLVLVFGGYLGLNLYPYAFGGSESRAWALLGAITTLSLVVMPLLAGSVGALIHRRSRHRKVRKP